MNKILRMFISGLLLMSLMLIMYVFAKVKPNNFKVLEALHNIRPDPYADFSFYKQALEEANNQIETFQKNETVVIFFLATTPNVGDEYSEILEKLTKNHKILTVGITDQSVYDLIPIASKVNEKSLSFVFDDFKSLSRVASTITNHRSQEIDCPQRFYTLPKSSLCHQDSITFYDAGNTYTAFFNKKTHNNSHNVCINAGGQLADFPNHTGVFKGVINKIMRQAKSCAALELWIQADLSPCASIAISSNRREKPTNNTCSRKLGRICKILCNSYPTTAQYDKNIWNCTEAATSRTCYVKCKGDSVLRGSDTVTCSKNGWTTITNNLSSHNTYFPICLDEETTVRKILTTIKYLIQETDGFLFLIDKSGLASNPDWKPLELITGIIRVFPISDHYPLGLIVFHEEAEVVIPYKATDSCKVLKKIEELKLEPPTNGKLGSAYDTVLKAAQEQILTFQPRRHTVIFFVTDRPNNGESYSKILVKLQERHTIFSVGVNNESLTDLQSLASINNDRLLIYKFNNVRTYNAVMKRIENETTMLKC